jgi:4-amino-4-deoxy-L-arabinose transferase-like glycosyltransferase
VLMQLLQACVAAAGVVPLYFLTLRLTASRTAAIWAGVLFAAHPLLVRQASAASDLAITATLVAAFALAFVRIRDLRTAALAGAILGVTVLTRSMVVPIVGLATVILLVRKQWHHAAAFAIAAAVVIAPMVARTYSLSRSLASTRSGVNLYIGNSPYTAALLPTYDLDLLEPQAYELFVRARLDVSPNDPRFAAEFDAFLTRQAFAHIAEHPWATLRQKLWNIAYLVSPRITPYDISGPDTRVRTNGNTGVRVEGAVPRSRLEVVAYAAATSVLLVGCIGGVYLRRRELPRDAILWAIFVTFAIVNAIYVPATRYTAPMQLVLMFYSAVAIARLHEGSRNAAVA